MTGRWPTAAILVGGLLLGAGCVAVARLSGLDLAWPVGALIGLSVAVLAVLGLRLPPADPLLPTPAERPTPPASTSFGDLGSLRFLVEADSADRQRFETRLRPRLVAVATERLWQHHGLDWRTEAGRAAAAPVLGPGVTALLTAAPGSLSLTPATLTRWIDELEAL